MKGGSGKYTDQSNNVSSPKSNVLKRIKDIFGSYNITSTTATPSTNTTTPNHQNNNQNINSQVIYSNINASSSSSSSYINEPVIYNNYNSNNPNSSSSSGGNNSIRQQIQLLIDGENEMSNLSEKLKVEIVNSKSMTLNTRLAYLREIMDCLRIIRVDDNLEQVWMAVQDLIEESKPMEYQTIAYQVMIALIDNNYGMLGGDLKRTFYTIIQSPSSRVPLHLRVRALSSLLRSGRDMVPFESTIIDILTRWLSYIIEQANINNDNNSTQNNLNSNSSSTVSSTNSSSSSISQGISLNSARDFDRIGGGGSNVNSGQGNSSSSLSNMSIFIQQAAAQQKLLQDQQQQQGSIPQSIPQSINNNSNSNNQGSLLPSSLNLNSIIPSTSSTSNLPNIMSNPTTTTSSTTSNNLDQIINTMMSSDLLSSNSTSTTPNNNIQNNTIIDIGTTFDEIFLLVRNVVQHGQRMLSEGDMASIINSICLLSNQSTNVLVIRHCIGFFETVAKMELRMVPPPCIAMIINALSKTVNIEEVCDPSCTTMQRLLERYRHQGIHALCALLCDPNNRQSITLLRGAVFFLGMSVWGPQRISTTLGIGPASVLPALFNSLAGKQEIIAFEVILALRRLIKKYGRELNVEWDLIFLIIERIYSIVRPINNNNNSSQTTDNQQQESERNSSTVIVLRDTISIIEDLDEKHQFQGSKTQLFNASSHFFKFKSEEAIAKLIDQQHQKIHPSHALWIVKMTTLVDFFFFKDPRTRIRRKMLSLMKQIYDQHHLIYGEEIVGNIILTSLSDIYRDKDPSVKIMGLEIVIEVATKVNNQQQFHALVTILDKAIRESLPIQIDVARISIMGMISIFSERFTHSQPALTLEVWSLILSHLSHENISIRRTILHCLAKLSSTKWYQVQYDKVSSPFLHCSPNNLFLNEVSSMILKSPRGENQTTGSSTTSTSTITASSTSTTNNQQPSTTSQTGINNLNLANINQNQNANQQNQPLSPKLKKKNNDGGFFSISNVWNLLIERLGKETCAELYTLTLETLSCYLRNKYILIGMDLEIDNFVNTLSKLLNEKLIGNLVNDYHNTMELYKKDTHYILSFELLCNLVSYQQIITTNSLLSPQTIITTLFNGLCQKWSFPSESKHKIQAICLNGLTTCIVEYPIKTTLKYIQNITKAIHQVSTSGNTHKDSYFSILQYLNILVSKPELTQQLPFETLTLVFKLLIQFFDRSKYSSLIVLVSFQSLIRWFTSCSTSSRIILVRNIIKGLDNQLKDRNSLLNEICIELLNRYIHTDIDPFHYPMRHTSPIFHDGQIKTWIQGCNSLITIRTGKFGWAEVTHRKATGCVVWLMRFQQHSFLNHNQLSSHFDLMYGGSGIVGDELTDSQLLNLPNQGYRREFSPSLHSPTSPSSLSPISVSGEYNHLQHQQPTSQYQQQSNSQIHSPSQKSQQPPISMIPPSTTPPISPNSSLLQPKPLDLNQLENVKEQPQEEKKDKAKEEEDILESNILLNKLNGLVKKIDLTGITSPSVESTTLNLSLLPVSSRGIDRFGYSDDEDGIPPPQLISSPNLLISPFMSHQQSNNQNNISTTQQQQTNNQLFTSPKSFSEVNKDNNNVCKKDGNECFDQHKHDDNSRMGREDEESDKEIRMPSFTPTDEYDNNNDNNLFLQSNLDSPYKQSYGSGSSTPKSQTTLSSRFYPPLPSFDDDEELLSFFSSSSPSSGHLMSMSIANNQKSTDNQNSYGKNNNNLSQLLLESSSVSPNSKHHASTGSNYIKSITSDRNLHREENQDDDSIIDKHNTSTDDDDINNISLDGITTDSHNNNNTSSSSNISNKNNNSGSNNNSQPSSLSNSPTSYTKQTEIFSLSVDDNESPYLTSKKVQENRMKSIMLQNNSGQDMINRIENEINQSNTRILLNVNRNRNNNQNNNDDSILNKSSDQIGPPPLSMLTSDSFNINTGDEDHGGSSGGRGSTLVKSTSFTIENNTSSPVTDISISPTPRLEPTPTQSPIEHPNSFENARSNSLSSSSSSSFKPVSPRNIHHQSPQPTHQPLQQQQHAILPQQQPQQPLILPKEGPLTPSKKPNLVSYSSSGNLKSSNSTSNIPEHINQFSQQSLNQMKQYIKTITIPGVTTSSGGNNNNNTNIVTTNPIQISSNKPPIINNNNNNNNNNGGVGGVGGGGATTTSLYQSHLKNKLIQSTNNQQQGDQQHLPTTTAPPPLVKSNSFSYLSNSITNIINQNNVQNMGSGSYSPMVNLFDENNKQTSDQLHLQQVPQHHPSIPLSMSGGMTPTHSPSPPPQPQQQHQHHHHHLTNSSGGGKMSDQIYNQHPDTIDPTILDPSIVFYHLHQFSGDTTTEIKNGHSFERALSVLDHTFCSETHKIGLIYVGSDQCLEEEYLSNSKGSPRYHQFLNAIGSRFKIVDRIDVYPGGLDRSGRTDGEYSLYWRDLITQVVFHVTTMMPATLETDPLFTNKKRHIGNDYVNIIYSDSPKPFNQQSISGQFNFVNIVIYPLDIGWYRVEIKKRKEIPIFGPIHNYQIISEQSLPYLIVQTAINANLISMQYDGKTEFISNLEERLKQIKTIKERFAKDDDGWLDLVSLKQR